ncbi:MAG: hypothetical protein MK193_01595 [Lentisphaeria bacterium]|nr:hypothetical protein [Lentisphaeria bacterium]
MKTTITAAIFAFIFTAPTYAGYSFNFSWGTKPKVTHVKAGIERACHTRSQTQQRRFHVISASRKIELNTYKQHVYGERQEWWTAKNKSHRRDIQLTVKYTSHFKGRTYTNYKSYIVYPGEKLKLAMRQYKSRYRTSAITDAKIIRAKYI